MLVFDADDQELELFLAENNDHLQLLDQNLVLLETAGNDQALLQGIFRSAHTIKGAAGLIGHQRMAELAHDMENVLDGLRSGKLQVTSSIIDALLQALDALRVLNEEVITRTESPVALAGIRAALATCLDAVPAAAEPPRQDAPWPVDEVCAELPEGVTRDQLFDVAVSVDTACGLSAARTLQVYLELKRSTRVLRCEPSLEQIEEDVATSALRALVALDAPPGALEQRLRHIGDVQEVRIAPVGGAVAPAAPGPHTPQIAAVAPGDAPAAPAQSGGDDVSRGPADRRPQQDSSIRISVGIVDNLMSLVSELVLGRTRLQTLRAQLQERYPSDDAVTNLEDAVGRLDQICSEMQATVMKARMVPVENVFNKFPRLVRDLAAHMGKQVQFTTRGNETELDRSVIEQLSDPLTHLLRNAIDHGLESAEERVAAGKPAAGSVQLSATPCENHILIEVRDDGRGIDGERLKASVIAKGLLSAEAADRLNEREAIELIFLPGFSTAKAVTDVSGRGVGMDIVKSTIERMGGRIAIESAVGVGTTFSITLPLTLAIMQALLVTLDSTVYAIPLSLVTEILSVPSSRIQMMQGTEATILRGTILPLVSLREYFGYGRIRRAGGVRHIVATRIDGQVIGLEVDGFIGEQEIVMKPLGTYMGVVAGLTGATILGDGRIGLLVDVAAVRNWSPEVVHARSA